MGLWIQFALVTAVVFYAGSKLSLYGDVIAEKTGMGRMWVGVTLMASVTSLPELFTGIGSVVIFELPDIAAGAVLGSCMFNVLIIALMDVSGPVPISQKVEQKHVLAAGFGIVMLAVAGMGIAAGPGLPALGWVGPYSLVLLFVYFLAMRTVFLLEKRSVLANGGPEAEQTEYDHISLRTAYRRYALNAVMVAGAATYLPRLGEEIAIVTGLGQTFVGSIFIAFTTSLPELVVSIAAVRIGAIDLMFGNLLGSNLFNMAILGVDDLLYFKGPLLADVSSIHIVTANAAIAMTGVVVISLLYRLSRKVMFVAWDSLAIISVYVVAVGVMFLMR